MHTHEIQYAILTQWTPLVFFFILLLAYLYGIILNRKGGKTWSSMRVVWFVCGTILMITALSPPLAAYAHQDLRGHMLQHLLIGMLAPLGFVLAAPLTLLLRILPGRAGRKVTSVLQSPPLHYITHPVTAFVLNIGGMFLLYVTPLYSAMLDNIYIHLFVHIHFFAAGYLFCWSIAGPDPAPRRPSLRLRFFVLFISIATHAYLSKMMYAHELPGNTPHSVKEIQDAARLMYYGGDLAELLLAIAFFYVWYNIKGRKSSASLT